VPAALCAFCAEAIVTPIELEELKKKSLKLEGNCQGLYFLFNENKLVYIGKGWNCLLRVAEHTRKDSEKSFTSWNFVQIEDAVQLAEKEKLLIQQYRPKYNVQFNSA
jgi:excinuclease UvrABC nuclease subunit